MTDEIPSVYFPAALMSFSQALATLAQPKRIDPCIPRGLSSYLDLFTRRIEFITICNPPNFGKRNLTSTICDEVSKRSLDRLVAQTIESKALMLTDVVYIWKKSPAVYQRTECFIIGTAGC